MILRPYYLINQSNDDTVCLFLGAAADDFFALGIIKKHIVMIYNLGSGLAVLKSKKAIDISRTWHFVVAGRTRQSGYLYLDGQPKTSGHSSGLLAGLDVFTPLFIGGYPNFKNLPSTVLGYFTQGFIGTLYDISFRTTSTDFTPLLMEHFSLLPLGVKGVGVEDGRNINEDGFDQCQNKPCANGGTCVKRSEYLLFTIDYQCHGFASIAFVMLQVFLQPLDIIRNLQPLW